MAAAHIVAELGRVPKYHQTDNSTAATHRIPADKEVVVEGRRRPFNEDSAK